MACAHACTAWRIRPTRVPVASPTHIDNILLFSYTNKHLLYICKSINLYTNEIRHSLPGRVLVLVAVLHRSWLQDTLKRKLVDFAWNRRFFYLPGGCSPFFGSTRLKFSINPIFFIRGACFDPSSGQPRVNPEKQEVGGGEGARKILKNRRVYISRYLAANDGPGCIAHSHILYAPFAYIYISSVHLYIHE